jgi:hypothetical protein
MVDAVEVMIRGAAGEAVRAAFGDSHQAVGRELTGKSPRELAELGLVPESGKPMKTGR